MERRKARSQPKVRPLAPWDKMFTNSVADMGGILNAHGHADRANTLDESYLRHYGTTPLRAAGLPLPVKQNLTGELHLGKAYTEADLRSRMRQVMENQIAYGVTRFDTCIDVTPDIGAEEKDYMRAWRVASELKAELADRITIRLAPNPIFGFKQDSGRWEVYCQAAEQADYLSCLPEKDEVRDEHNSDKRVGFRKHIRMVMELACRLKKEVHLHLDQADLPNESGTETLLQGLDWIDQPEIPGHNGPAVWVIHMISPSCYSEERFHKLVAGLLTHKVGVIICPTAALSMRQLRPVQTYKHNSIARFPELCVAGVPLRFGSDNIGDVFVPAGDGDMLTEVKTLAQASRMYLVQQLAKIAAGRELNHVDRNEIASWLDEDVKAFRGIDPNWQPAV